MLLSLCSLYLSLTMDIGKPLSGGSWDITATIQNFRYHAGWADKISGQTIEVSGCFFYKYDSLCTSLSCEGQRG